ncbi:MAG: sigma-70 family RNA polymerase sigma factor [Firmicutes bacterium]|nr:sigma-70 family RNA polymerase sigma factor [Bacillota bacterium]
MSRKSGPAADPAVLRERQLIDRAKKGDPSAFNELMEAYSRTVFNIGLQMLHDRDDASDMTQETMIKVYRALPRFRGDAAFSTWVYRIMVNTCRDFLRSAARRRETPFSDFGEEDDGRPLLEAVDDSAQPERLYLEAESEEYLLSLIRRLRPEYRLVLTMRELGGLSYQEIAEAGDLSVGTVKSRLNRARAALREQVLADAEQFPGLLRLMDKGGAEDGMH